LPATERERLFPHGLMDGFAIECAEFLRAIRHQWPVEIDAQMGLSTLAVSLSLYESALSGRTVQIAEVLDGSAHRYQDSLHAAADGVLDGDFSTFRTSWPPVFKEHDVRDP
jgi:hypothetical protein